MAIILIVDDDPTVRLIAGELLRGDDHAIVEAEDGDEALRIVDVMAVDLVVLDMLMPNKDGLETIVELRQRQSDIRILAISSGGSMDRSLLLRTARVLGADESLQKPLRLDTFADTVARLLARPRTPVSLTRSAAAS
ncbi:response regulator [Aquidulcibacter paucihalophilus]|nr:response regulator [Aquidulcibacter paucihalophilus]